MKISEIKTFPNTLGTGANGMRFHESIFRSYQILEKVKELLRKQVAPSVVLEIIEDIEMATDITKEL